MTILENYSEDLDVEVSPCPYCGGERKVVHDYSSSYEREDEYRVEHKSIRDAIERDCFLVYYSFSTVEEAVAHADMRTMVSVVVPWKDPREVEDGEDV